MNIQEYTYLLEHPETIDVTSTSQLKEVIEAFPFFQSANALYLKGLKNQGSFTYNRALKKTAAHTTDRAVLFDYITSKEFLQNDISVLIKEQKSRLRSIIVNEAHDLSSQIEKEEQEKASQILDPNLFIEKEDSVLTSSSSKEISVQDETLTSSTAEETLKVGTPLPFTRSETHSFSEWLKLPSITPIDRSNEEDIITRTPTDTNLDSKEQSPLTEALSKERKQQIIDSFIEANPKIQIKTPAKGEKLTTKKINTFSSDALMTETLARVYVEQSNYKKAKQAFRILSLKYPEKSGFFADQIRAIEKLEEQKE